MSEQITVEGNIVRGNLAADKSGPAFALLTRTNGGRKTVTLQGNSADVHGQPVYQWVDHVADQPQAADQTDVGYMMGDNLQTGHQDPYWMSAATVKRDYPHLENCLIPINNSNPSGDAVYNLMWVTWEHKTYKIPMNMV